jgi:hypothetical protein
MVPGRLLILVLPAVSLLPLKTNSWLSWFLPVIPATQEVKIRKSWFETSLGQKLTRAHLNHYAGHGGMCLIPNYVGDVRIVV